MDSRPGQGQCSAYFARNSEPVKIMPNRARPKVLIVDDEPAVRVFFREALKNHVEDVVEAANAAEALESVESGDFDVILCDVWMPGASGVDLLAMAKQTRLDVGFILVTGEFHIDTVITALRMQVSDFLLKPLTVNEIVRSVNGAYERLVASRNAQAYKGSLENGIQRRTRELELALSELECNYQMTLEALVASLDSREHETYSHSLRVRAYTRYLARRAGYRKGPGFEAAQSEVLKGSGSQFDPHIAALFLKIPSSTWVKVRVDAANDSVSGK
jgi:response regulator RpfG family c-di-GMP phosphodiesterase